MITRKDYYVGQGWESDTIWTYDTAPYTLGQLAHVRDLISRYVADALVQGASFGEALKAGIISGVTAVAFAGVSGAFTNAGWASGSFVGKLSAAGFGAKVAVHGVLGGISSMLSGGKFGHGFASAGFTVAATTFSYSKFPNALGKAGARVVVNATIGGTASKLSGGKFANGAVATAFAYAIAHGARTLSADSVSRPEEYTREYFGEAPDDPQAVFDEAIRASENNQHAQAPGVSQVKFINRVAVGGCSDSACDTITGVKTLNTLDSAIIYANESSNRVIVNGAAYNGNAYIYRTATFTGNYEIGYNQLGAGTVLSLGHVENTIHVIAHETGHLLNYPHRKFKMYRRERKAIELHSNNQVCYE